MGLGARVGVDPGSTPRVLPQCLFGFASRGPELDQCGQASYARCMLCLWLPARNNRRFRFYFLFIEQCCPHFALDIDLASEVRRSNRRFSCLYFECERIVKYHSMDCKPVITNVCAVVIAQASSLTRMTRLGEYRSSNGLIPIFIGDIRSTCCARGSVLPNLHKCYYRTST